MMMETVPSGTILHGRYRIERVLGSGGFGHVYLALDLQTNQQFAIKEYFVTGSSGQAQLQHEARVLSQLHHPNLPAFHEAFSERNHYFVVLSYIEGSDLTDLIRIARQRNEPIPLSRVLGWILSVCDAVYFLHNQPTTVIHRDIKPDNIRITPNGTAILVDLGNAKATADGARTLFFIRHQGTPGYAPQEQYPGGSGTNAQSDVYALGATLYFALTSHEPPSVSTRNASLQQGLPDLPSLQEQLANNPPEESAEAQAARQFRLGVTKPAKPAQRHIRHLAQLSSMPPELLEQLNRIIRRSMQMKQRDRYPTVAEFRSDLRKVLEAMPKSSALPDTPGPSPRPPDPNSTQPDLPMLYEAIEAARSAPHMPASPASSRSDHAPAQPAPPAQSQNCPRCGTSLVKAAAYCPSCGSAINSAQSNPASSEIAARKLSQQQQPFARAARTVDQAPTMPQSKAQSQLQQIAIQTEAQPRSVTGQPGTAQATQARAQLQAHAPASANPFKPAQAQGLSTQAKLLIAVIAIVIVLLVIMILAIILISHSHPQLSSHAHIVARLLTLAAAWPGHAN
jgi:serine/threonine protein kinase